MKFLISGQFRTDKREDQWIAGLEVLDNCSEISQARGPKGSIAMQSWKWHFLLLLLFCISHHLSILAVLSLAACKLTFPSTVPFGAALTLPPALQHQENVLCFLQQEYSCGCVQAQTEGCISSLAEGVPSHTLESRVWGRRSCQQRHVWQGGLPDILHQIKIFLPLLHFFSQFQGTDRWHPTSLPLQSCFTLLLHWKRHWLMSVSKTRPIQL